MGWGTPFQPAGGRNYRFSSLLTLVMDSGILFFDSICVGQFAKKNRSESFVGSFVQSSFR